MRTTTNAPRRPAPRRLIRPGSLAVALLLALGAVPVLASPATAGAPDPVVAAWGLDRYRSLGIATGEQNNPVPVRVRTGALAHHRVTAVDAGTNRSCAIASGRAYCWGLNGGNAYPGGPTGAIGSGTTDVLVPRPVAVSTDGPLGTHTVTDISTGYLTSCAVASGRAYCWGNDTYGQLGDGAVSHGNGATTPVAVTGLGNRTVTRISTGLSTTCAVADHEAWCWGSNSDGKLGQGGSPYALGSTQPVQVSGLSGRTVTEISVGDTHVCAVADGRAYCWGEGNRGVGIGQTTDDAVTAPVAVDTSGVLHGRTVTRISAGQNITCALADRRAYCWGLDFGQDQLGNGGANGHHLPVTVSTPGSLHGRTITDISVGATHGCLVASRRSYCWGDGSGGMLGSHGPDYSAVPRPVSTAGAGAGRVLDISTGDGFSLEALVPAAASKVVLKAKHTRFVRGHRPARLTAKVTPHSAQGTMLFKVDGHKKKVVRVKHHKAHFTLSKRLPVGKHHVVALFRPKNATTLRGDTSNKVTVKVKRH